MEIIKKSDFTEQISIVLPVYNEEENIPILAKEIEECFDNSNIKWECIWVDDSSTDKSWKIINSLKKPHKGIRLVANKGQSTAIMAGIDESKHEVIVMLDADLQNDPRDIIKMLQELKSDVDVVCGRRIDRSDPFFTKRLPSLVANYLARKVSKVSVNDLGCTLRVCRKSVFDRARMTGEMHRVLAIYLFFAGAKIVEIPVKHRPRIYGKSKYGLIRILKFVSDLILAKYIKTIETKPMYFFGAVALFNFTLTVFLTILTLEFKKYFGSEIDRLIYITIYLSIVLSILLISFGLLAELIVRLFAVTKLDKNYLIRERTA